MLAGSISPSNSEKICLTILAHHVGQHVQPAAVRHADHHFGHVVGGGALQNLLQNGQRGFAAFQREALLAHEAGMQEVLELLGGDQVAQRAHARVAASSGQWLASGSMRCCSQRFCSGTWMFMYSQPILPQ